MRISVCEFLRLTTHRNWFYINPGHWGADGMGYQCKRIKKDTFALMKGNRVVKQLEYFEGKPALEVRLANRKRIHRVRQ